MSKPIKIDSCAVWLIAGMAGLLVTLAGFGWAIKAGVS